MSKKRGNEKQSNNKNVSADLKEKLYECVYIAKTEKYGFALSRKDKVPDIYIPQELNAEACVMDGDIILVSIINEEKRVGKIVEILERATVSLVGIFSNNMVKPALPNLQDVYIKEKNQLSVTNGDAVLIEILKYPSLDAPAEGKILKVLRSKDDHNILIQALYAKHGLEEKGDFSHLEKELKKIKTEVTAEDFEGREDRTGQLVFTIDPPDAMDIDDAIALEIVDGKYKLSVHIANVTHYVKDGSAIDEKATKRCTSIYIPGTCIPMLPNILSNGICSLNEGVLRLALSADMIIDHTGQIIESRVYKSVIKVAKKMSYDKVYKAIEGLDPQIVEEYSEYIPKLKEMKELSLLLKQKRLLNGSIDLNVPETKISLNDSGDIDWVGAYEKTYANDMIEEFMLAANMSVAEYFFWLDIPFIYRVHDDPDPEKIADLSVELKKYGIKKALTGGMLANKLATILKDIQDEEIKSFIAEKILRSLKQARYSSEQSSHFGLAADYYCHFTSPIRRYPDTFIHRVIEALIDNNNVLPDELRQVFVEQAKKYAEESSRMEREADEIEREFDKLYLCIYMEDKIGEKFDSVITSVLPFGMFVKLPNTVEGLIPIDSLSDDKYVFDEEKSILVGKNSGKIYKPGIKQTVELTSCDAKLMQINFKIC